jgi:hypothetical protein
MSRMAGVSYTGSTKRFATEPIRLISTLEHVAVG